MKNGWYKIEHNFNNNFVKHDESVYVENDMITDIYDEYGDHKKEVNVRIDSNMKKHMVMLGFGDISV